MYVINENKVKSIIQYNQVKFYLVLDNGDTDEAVYDVPADFINKSTGSIQRTIMHMAPSARPRSPFTLSEYSQGDIPSGAKLPKKTTPEMKWKKYLEKIAVTAPRILLFGKNPAIPKARYGSG